MAGTIQQTYNVNPGRGFPGLLAEPSAPHRTDSGVLHVPTNGTVPKPGMALYYDAAQNAFRLPTDAATTRAVVGILSYRKDDVANASQQVVFKDKDEIELITVGVVWVTAGGAVEYGQQVVWQHGDQKWDALARVTTIATMHSLPIFSVNRFAVADGGLFKAAIGYGRAI